MKKILLLTLVAILTSTIYSHSHSRTHYPVKVRTAIDKPFILSGAQEPVVVKVALSGLEKTHESDRMPLNIAIVLDKSGSMGSQHKMENAKRGAIDLIERLKKGDIVSLVVYDNAPKVLIPAQPLRNKDLFIHAIQSIQASGSTALYGGVTFGAAEVRKHASDDYVNRILLLSDGLANVGPKSTNDHSRLGQSLETESISVTTVGVGLDYNEDLMTALSDKSAGNSYFANNSDDLPEIFAQEVGEAMTLAARDVVINFQCLRGATPISIIGRDGEISGNSLSVKIPNLYSMNEKYVLFEVLVPKSHQSKPLEIGIVDIHYFEPRTKEVFKHRRSINLKLTKDRNLVQRSLNKEIIKDVALTRTSDIKEFAIEMADKGQYKQASGLLERRGHELRKIAKRLNNDADLVEESVKSFQLAKEIKANRGMTKYHRKLMRNQAWTQKNQQYYVPSQQSERRDSRQQIMGGHQSSTYSPQKLRGQNF